MHPSSQSAYSSTKNWHTGSIRINSQIEFITLKIQNPNQWVSEKLYMLCRRLYLRASIYVIRNNTAEILLRILFIVVNLAIISHFAYTFCLPVETTYNHPEIGTYFLISSFSLSATYKILYSSVYRCMSAQQKKGLCF